MDSRNQKICFFLGALKLGGIGKTSINLMGSFIKRGIGVDLYLTHYVGEYISQIPEGVNVIVGEGNYLKRFIKYARYLTKVKPDAVISARDSLNLFSIFTCYIFSPNTIRIATLRTNQTVENLHHQKKMSGLMKFIYKNVYKQANKIIAVSKGVAKDFSNRFDIHKVKVIYNPVYKKDLAENTLDFDSPIKQISNPNFKFILGVGRLRMQKDFESLILAFKTVSSQIDDVSLIILGEGEDRKKLENLIQDLNLSNKVFLPGFVPNPQQYMNRAEVFVLSSLWEGFGNVLVDALGAGCKIVSTNCPSGPSEILNDGEFGILTEPGNIDALSEAIIESIRSYVDPQVLINRAESFSVDTIANKYLEFIFDDKIKTD